jgi:hypothetical protein
MQLRTKLRRLRKPNFCSFAWRWQSAFFSASSLLAAAISPGDLGFEEDICAQAAHGLRAMHVAKTAEAIAIRNMIQNPFLNWIHIKFVTDG